MNAPKTISLYELAILYRIIMKRTAKNFSTLQLSFLIGKPDDYVNKVELLQSPFYTAEDIRCIATALDDDDEESYYSINAAETKVQAVMKKDFVNNTCVFTCDIITAEGEKSNYFTLQDDGECFKFSEEEAKFQTSIATHALCILIKTNYFYEAQLAVQVYTGLKFFLMKTISPSAVKEAFNMLILENSPLLRLVAIGESRFAYQQP